MERKLIEKLARFFTPKQHEGRNHLNDFDRYLESLGN